MKIVKQTDSYLMLRQNPTGVCFLLIWASLFAGAPLFIITGLIKQAGVTQLSCQRLESAEVDCQWSRSHWLGLSQSAPTELSQIQAAQLNSETRSDEDSDYQVYQVLLTTPASSTAITDFNTDYSTQNSWVTQLNQFVQSPAAESQLTLIQDSRWSLKQTIAPMLFLSLFVVIGAAVLHGTIRVRTLILDKTLNRLIYRRQTLLGTRQYDFPLGVVKAVQLKEHTDSYGNKSYEPILLPDLVKQVTFSAISNRQQALQLQEQIRQFLNLCPQPEPALPSEVASVYQNQNRSYTTSGLTTLPNTATDPVKTIDRQLLKLGFAMVGDLKPAHFPAATLYCYVQSNKDIYAVITTITHQTPFASLDFYTQFFNGTMLVTTSSKLIVNSLKSQKLQRCSYPNMNPSPLYQQHQQHLTQLQMESGRTHRTQTELTPIAAVLDDYFTRQTSGWFPMLATLLNAIAIATQNRKSA